MGKGCNNPSSQGYEREVFIWRVLIGGLPLELALKCRGLTTGNYLIYTIQIEDNTHRFIQYLIVCQIWSYIAQN